MKPGLYLTPYVKTFQEDSRSNYKRQPKMIYKNIFLTLVQESFLTQSQKY